MDPILLQALNFSLVKLGESVDQFNAFNERSLEISKAYSTVMQENTKSLAGVKIGLESKFLISLELQRNAIQGNNQGLAKLAGVQEALGLRSAETIKTFKDASVVGMISNNSMNKLAESTIEAAMTYGVSTDVLVEAIDKLAESTENIGLAGGDSGQFLGAVQTVIGQLGGSRNADRVTQFANMLMDTSLANQQRLVTLGIKNIQDLFLAGGVTQDQQSQLLMEAMETASTSVTNFAGSTALNVEQQKTLFGKEVPGLVRSLANELGKINIEKQDPAKALQRIMDNFENVFEATFAPLEGFMMKIAETIISYVIPAFKFLGLIIENVVVPVLETIVSVISFFADILSAYLMPTIRVLVDFISDSYSTLVESFSYAKEALFAFGVGLAAVSFGGIFPLMGALLGLTTAIFATSVRFIFLAFASVASLITTFGALFIAMLPVIWPFLALGAAIYFVLDALGIGFSDILNGVKVFFAKIGDILGSSVGLVAGVFKSLYDIIKLGILVQFNGLMIILDSLFLGIAHVVKFIASVSAMIGIPFADSVVDFLDKQIDASENRIKTRALDTLGAVKSTVAGLKDNFGNTADNTAQIAANTRKPPELPKFLLNTNIELRDAFQAMLGISSNPTQQAIAAGIANISANTAATVNNTAQTTSAVKAIPPTQVNIPNQLFTSLKPNPGGAGP